MSELQFRLTGKNAAIVGAIVLVLAVVRIATIGDADSSDLDRAIRGELLNRIGAQTSEALENIDVTDEEAVRELSNIADSSGIEIFSIRVSRPLIPTPGASEPIVRIEFELPGSGRHTEYWRFEHSLLAGWRYKRPSNVLSYYLNFI